MPIPFTELREGPNLAQRVLAGEQGAVDPALALFERHDPTTLAQAARLIDVHGQLPEAIEQLARASTATGTCARCHPTSRP